MRKYFMIMAAGAVVAAIIPTGAAAASSSLADLVRAQDLPAFAGYQVASANSAATIITVPDASTCPSLEMTGAVSFMGSGEAGSYAYTLVGAKCEPGFAAEYIAMIQTHDGITMYPDELVAGDKMKITMVDDGTATVVTMTRLAGGTPLEVTTSTLPDAYEVGITSFGGPLVRGKVRLTKNRVDGAKLKAAGPAKVIFEDGTYTFEPKKLRKGKNFKVVSG